MWQSHHPLVLALACESLNVQLSMCLQIGRSDLIGYSTCWEN